MAFCVVACSTRGSVEDAAGKEPICHLGNSRRSSENVEVWAVIGVGQTEKVLFNIGPIGEAGAVVCGDRRSSAGAAGAAEWRRSH